MRRHLLIAGLVVLGLLALGVPIADKLRSATIATVSLPKRGISGFFASIGNLFGKRSEEEFALLQVENLHLKDQVNHLAQFERYQDVILEQLARLELWEIEGSSQRADKLAALVELELAAVPARVVYRPSGSWNQSFWINVGERSNRKLGETVVAKDSPVVSGRSVVGLVDYVGERRSRVKLLTDSQCHVAVRIARGEEQDTELIHHLEAIDEALQLRKDLGDQEEARGLRIALNTLRSNLEEDAATMLLAKGEMCGSVGRSPNGLLPLLRGEGFNLDYADEESPARDLRTGMVEGGSSLELLTLVKPGDLLVTSGLDGVFPPGLWVGRVAKVEPLREGAYYYNLLATPTVGHFSRISTVTVLPALAEQPCKL